MATRLGRTALLVIAALVAVGLPAAPAAPAAAEPPSSGVQQIKDAQLQLDELNEQVDIAVEDYAEGRIALEQATRAAEQATDRVARARRRLAALKRATGDIAAAAYRNGGGMRMFSVVVASDPQAFLGRATTLEHVSRTQLDRLGVLRAADIELRREQQAADRAVAQAKALTRRLDKIKASIEKSVVQQQALVAKLKAEEAARVRAAKLAEARRQARLRAEAAARAERHRQAREAAARAAAKAAAERLAAQRAEDARQARADRARAERKAAERRAQERREREEAERREREEEERRRASRRRRTPPPKRKPDPQPEPPSTSNRADIAVMWARRQLGKPYVWAADGPDTFDCSGLTQYVWAKAGVSLPHSSRMQFHSGRRVDKSQLRPGDLVFYGSPIHHVGIYIGGGQYINAPQTGDVVKISSIYRKEWTGAVRL